MSLAFEKKLKAKSHRILLFEFMSLVFSTYIVIIIIVFCG